MRPSSQERHAAGLSGGFVGREFLNPSNHNSEAELLKALNIMQYLTSVLETCRLKRKSILIFLKDVLKTPDEKLHEKTESLLKPT